ncbi:7904ec08-cf70-49a5-9aff-d3629ba26d90 [Thermothielavioides terrestris]|uniref:7904ec08-cf70-49a5-9aff-d3629ba26d90 n=1 Tax=Thermothielavioides terrestris TaxID=2587410 RepID=A0A3S4AYS0_9PEZI|nr:7904ec08-cf70-49a5-9aff-d3629ba26d90 [Thermothielavioides terrestris]
MADTCKSCHDPLILALDPDESGDEGQTVPDDLHLPCGCHFHWQCLLDLAAEIVAAFFLLLLISISTTTTNRYHDPAPILTTYTNEGGVQPDLDIAPHLAEEAFLTAHPYARPARAFHALVAEGDVPGMLDLLGSLATTSSGSTNPAELPSEGEGEGEGEGEISLTPAQLLAWRDPLNGLRGALHVALEARQEEAVWALLWLGSGVARAEFPAAVVQAAEGMGLPRCWDEVS